HIIYYFLFFFNTPPTTAIYTLSLHDALPISGIGVRGSESSDTTPSGTRTAPGSAVCARSRFAHPCRWRWGRTRWSARLPGRPVRSEEHTSELQSRFDLVCRLLLEKKNKKIE